MHRGAAGCRAEGCGEVVWLPRRVSGRLAAVERLLALLVVTLLVGCFTAGFFAVQKFAAAEDLHGLLFAGIMLTAGVSAYRILNVPGGEG